MFQNVMGTFNDAEEDGEHGDSIFVNDKRIFNINLRFENLAMQDLFVLKQILIKKIYN